MSKTEAVAAQNPPHVPGAQRDKSADAAFSLSNYLITIAVWEAFIFTPLIWLGVLRNNLPVVPVIMLGVLLLGSVFYFTVLFSRRLYRVAVEKRLQSQELVANVNSLQETISEDFFTKLVRINFNYIDKYYLQTQVQADRSFMLCVAAAAVSLLIIVIGIVLMYIGYDVKPAYITTATGALGEIISAVFFYLYNRTILEMSDYHQKLVLTQNISLALKIADDLPAASQSDAKIELIKCLSKDINMYLTLQGHEAKRVVAEDKLSPS
jgi:hypothetical protein